MKLLELGLAPFGPFSDLRLDLSAPAGLHLVFGKNEAGKSTSLRAISGLFYGIPPDTRDAHKHAMPELRISGKLLGKDGVVLDIVRRKGRKNTLLDPAGNPFDDAALTRALGGVSEELFRSMFGLDHETLRRGAEALLRGKGDLGETLFDAGVGGAAVHDVLAELEEEAARLYRPRASTATVNRELKELSEARRRARQAATDPAAWERQQQELAAAVAELRSVEEARRDLRAEQSRLERIRRALPKLRERAELGAELAQLGAVRLPPDVGARRQKLENNQEKQIWDLERLRREIAADEHKRASHQFSERLARLEDERRISIGQRLGAFQKNAKDLPKRRAEQKSFEAEAHALAARLGVGSPLDAPDKWQLDAPTQTRIRELVQRHAVLERALSDGKSELAETRAELARVRAELALLPAPRDCSELVAELGRAERAGDLEARIAELTREVRALSQSAEQAARALGLGIELADVAALPVVSAETLDGFDQRFSAIEQRRLRLEEARGAAERDVRRLEKERRELSRGGDVPSRARLDESRTRRDALWQKIRAEWSEPLALELEHAQRDADRIADELWRNAERVARAEAIAADLAELAAGASELDAKDSELAASLEALRADWRSVWEPLGIEPRSPREMRAWLGGFERLLSRSTTLAERRSELERAESAALEHRRALAEQLDPGPGSELALPALAERARAVLDAESARSRQRELLERARQELERTEAARAARALHRERELEAWQGEWREAALAFADDRVPSPAELAARLDLIESVRRSLEKVADWRRRIEGMERDDRALAKDVALLAREFAPELADLPVERAATTLVREHEETRKIESKLAEIDARLSDKREELADLELRHQLVERELAALVQSAGVSSLAELRLAERRSERARQIEARLAEIDRELADDRAGRPLEELEAEARSIDLDRAKARLLEIEESFKELEEKRDDLRARVQSAESGLMRFGQSTAVEAEQEAHALAARVREHADHYVRVKLAATILRREIERYRERHQGPVVERASDLFRRLTRGSFVSLKADIDDSDQPILSGVRTSGQVVRIDGLSEGTREQLYLALRLASLEHFGEHNELLPLVLDDVLIHSDQERQLAALELLGELGASMQILLFSHHAHLVELAKKAVPAARLAVHELDAVAGVVTS